MKPRRATERRARLLYGVLIAMFSSTLGCHSNSPALDQGLMPDLSSAPATDGTSDGADLGGALKPFGERCSTNAECASNLCFTFGDGSQLCTLVCSSSDQCPSGSQGRKCNAQGYCRQ